MTLLIFIPLLKQINSKMILILALGAPDSSVSLVPSRSLWIRAETQTGIPHHPQRTQAAAIQLKSD